MNRKLLLRQSFGQRGYKAAFIVVLNSFSWYFPLYVLFLNALGNRMEYSMLLPTLGVHYAAAVAFAFLGNFLTSRFGRNKLLSVWMLTGIVASASMVFVNTGHVELVLLASFLLGLSVGLGFPSCLSLFGDYATVENRGLLGGIAFSFTCLGMLLFGLVAAFVDITLGALIFTLWRCVGLAIFLRTKPQEKNKGVLNSVSYTEVVHDKGLILYMIPWVMFCVINWLEIPFFDLQLQQQYLGTNLRYMISIGEFGIGGISSLIGGLLSDIIGRKRLIISAYVLVGIGYAAVSFSSMNTFFFYFYVLVDGIAWGIFMLMFFLTIWGDLAENRSKEKYYLMGTLPFLVSSFIPAIVTPYAGAIPVFTAFSLASFFLFLAILPLVYAPETLPEKEIKERELKGYIEKAKKMREKKPWT
jgi:MFS family permease